MSYQTGYHTGLSYPVMPMPNGLGYAATANNTPALPNTTQPGSGWAMGLPPSAWAANYLPMPNSAGPLMATDPLAQSMQPLPPVPPLPTLNPEAAGVPLAQSVPVTSMASHTLSALPQPPEPSAALMSALIPPPMSVAPALYGLSNGMNNAVNTPSSTSGPQTNNYYFNYAPTYAPVTTVTHGQPTAVCADKSPTTQANQSNMANYAAPNYTGPTGMPPMPMQPELPQQPPQQPPMPPSNPLQKAPGNNMGSVPTLDERTILDLNRRLDSTSDGTGVPFTRIKAATDFLKLLQKNPALAENPQTKPIVDAFIVKILKDPNMAVRQAADLAIQTGLVKQPDGEAQSLLTKQAQNHGLTNVDALSAQAALGAINGLEAPSGTSREHGSATSQPSTANNALTPFFTPQQQAGMGFPQAGPGMMPANMMPPGMIPPEMLLPSQQQQQALAQTPTAVAGGHA